RSTIFRYLTTATQNRTAPGVGTPKWTRKKNGKYLENHWSMEVDAGWRPVEGETFEFLSAPSLDGPWFSHLGRRHEPHRKAPVKFNSYQVRMGQRAFLRTRIRYGPKGRYMGEHWSQPVEIYRKPEGMPLYGDIGPSIPIFGKKGQKLSVTVTGTWDPVRFEGLGAYGPEGIPESVFRERALDLIEAENALPEKEKESNQPNLLGLTLPGTTADPPAPKAKGGLKDVGYFLLRKRSLVFNRLPAGCLAAQYVSSDSAYRKYGRNSPFSQQYESNGLKATMQVDRNWSFTFPRDGFVTFTANHSHGWTGSHYFQGGGQLQLQFDLGAVPEAAEQGPADWLPPQRKAAVTTSSAARAVSDPVERVPESQSRLKPGTSNTGPGPNRDSSSQRTPESQSRLKPGTANTDPSPARSDPPRQRVPEDSSSPQTPTSRDNPAPETSPAETNPETVVTTNVPPPGVDPPAQKESDAKAASQALARGNKLFQSGKVEEALKQYETALELSPESPETLLGAGRSRNATGDVKGAIAAYDRLVRLKPDTPNIGAWLAESYLALGDRKGGRAWLDWGLKRSPNSAWTNSFMGTLEIMEGNQQVAAKHFARANALDPNIGNQRYQNATFLASRGQHTRALWDFTAALQLNPRLFHTYYGLGVSCAALGENLNAIRQFNFYLQFDQESEWATKARQEINRLSRLNERR
ncbi:MAG: tetratricopeptide repeat protein, partial [Planctomycetota bacterium]|nr:tetratricopeptide repeat protein [Planctomycetota bacterium]